MTKYYAIREGHQTGIYQDWNEVQPLVIGYSGAVYKSFTTEMGAIEFMTQGQELMELHEGTLTAQINYKKDSNPKNSFCVIDYYKDNEKAYEENVTINYNSSIKYEHDIEFIAVVRAMQRAIDLGYKNMNIIYNYPGVLDYLTGYWTAREDSALAYIRRFFILNGQIDVGFTRCPEDVLH